MQADEESRDVFDRLLRGRQSDPQQRPFAECRQAFQRERKMAAALVGRQRVDLIDNHRPRRREHGPAGLGAQQDVQRLRRGDHDMRRPAAHAIALARRRIAGAHPGADVHRGQTAFAQSRGDAGERRFQISLDVVGERLEWRDVNKLRLVPKIALEALANEAIDCREKGGKRLARSGRSGDQDIPARLDGWPRLSLRARRRGKTVAEPRRHRRME
jgi:hypothetical protein